MDRSSNSPVDIAQKWGFDQQVSEHKQSINLTQNLIGILQEKCELQTNYARGVNRLSVRLKEALASAPSGTVHSSWSHIGNVLDSEAKIHQSSALGLLEGLVKPWLDLIEELTKSRKPLKSQIEKATHQWLTLSANELRAKKKLNAAYRACERTWYSHMQSLRSASIKPVTLNGPDSGSVGEPEAVQLSPTVHIPKHQLRAYHSFREGSTLDLTTSNSSSSNTMDGANRRITVRRHYSARSATLPSPSSTLQSSDSSGVLATKIAPAVNKTKEACYAALCEYYKACMSAEEARVEWHTALLKCLHEQRALERQRLQAMVNGLTVYQRLVNEAIPELKSMATEITDALRQADPTADVEAFRQRSHDNRISSNGSNCSGNPVSDQSNDSKPAAGIVGRSQQRLLELPGEKSMLQHLLCLRSNQPNGDPVSAYRLSGHLSLDRSPNHTQWYQKGPNTTNHSFDLRGHLRQCLTRECLFDHLDLLTKDVQKERRTKQGLSNLVQVYSREPAYADAQTLIEVRRRLFVSRVRLTHLTNCRQKLIYSLICALPSNQTGPLDGAPKHIYVEALTKAGFSNLPWTVVMTSSAEGPNSRPQPVASTRWVPVPDLDDESAFNKLTKPLEWPPFPSSELPYEDLNDDLFDWEIERLRLLDADLREHGPCDPISLPCPISHEPTIGSGLKTVSFTAENNTTTTVSDNLPSPNRLSNRWSGDYQAQSFRLFPPNKPEVGSVATNGLLDNRYTVSAVGRPRNGSNATDPEKRLSNSGDSGQESGAVGVQSGITLATHEQYESDADERLTVPVPIRRSASSGRTRLSAFSLARFRRSTSAVKRAKSFDHGQSPHSSVVTECNVTTATETPMKNTSTTPTTNAEASVRPNHITIEYETAPDDSQHSVQTKSNGRTHSFSSRFWSKFRSSAREAREVKVNGHSPNSAADSGFTTSDQLINELAAVQRRRRDSKDHFIGSRDNASSWSTSVEAKSRTVHFGSVESHPITPEAEYVTDRSQWPSNLSLHCVGWAKVEQSYVAKQPDELTLLEGDIVSIYRKENDEWWYGEVNGCKGRFPVSHVDEF